MRGILPENDLLVRTESSWGYGFYLRRCEEIRVRPFSRELWEQVLPWLKARGRVAVLEVLRAELLDADEDVAISEACAS
jgi:hypothetical protein